MTETPLLLQRLLAVFGREKLTEFGIKQSANIQEALQSPQTGILVHCDSFL